jgi:hypothetical protein
MWYGTGAGSGVWSNDERRVGSLGRASGCAAAGLGTTCALVAGFGTIGALAGFGTMGCGFVGGRSRGVAGADGSKRDAGLGQGAAR